ncbi:NYN domain-containing protein [Ramlibacter sp. H39-3-26]|uniref:NYN domain-containing protein n=1 Tax=Curvibacter soli TaxID=3031331 RepID=UPI0023DBA168|nr:NYN domain-containing protein [Ramlibacter sp. H39-3-26]MDF1483907.1 NYN domain-containing protein [Ramlibacter sp. H39-3-26]
MTSDPLPSAALLIDADNLSPTAVDEAFAHLRALGAAIPVRRAYGGLEKLAGMKDVLRRHAVRAVVNQGKGTTDVALVVDAMDLLHCGALPAVVAIGSSDADFSPLAVRLREAGLRVLCFAQQDKAAADELPRAYDKVVYVDTAPRADRQPAPMPAAPPARPAPAAAHAAAHAPDGAGEEADAVRRILAALPKWQPDTVKQLNQLGTPLRESGISKSSKPLHELFRKYPTYFKVLPATGQAKQVRLLRKP